MKKFFQAAKELFTGKKEEESKELKEMKSVPAGLKRWEKQLLRKYKKARFTDVLRAHWRDKSYREMQMKRLKKAQKLRKQEGEAL